VSLYAEKQARHCAVRRSVDGGLGRPSASLGSCGVRGVISPGPASARTRKEQSRGVAHAHVRAGAAPNAGGHRGPRARPGHEGRRPLSAARRSTGCKGRPFGVEVEVELWRNSATRVPVRRASHAVMEALGVTPVKVIRIPGGDALLVISKGSVVDTLPGPGRRVAFGCARMLIQPSSKF